MNWHFRISMVKSGMRIIAGICLLNGDLFKAGCLFVLAEILGIAEELF
jgi:hypothetical protein